MTTSTEVAYPQAVMLLPAPNLALLTHAKALCKAMDNPPFTTVAPPLPVFQKDIQDFDNAATKAAGKGKGTARARNAKRKKVRQDIRRARDYIQGLAENAPTPDDAAVLI